jgi:hypothetical protein
MTTILDTLPYHLLDCIGMDDEIAAIEAWAQIFKSRPELIATITKHMILHKSEVKQDVSDVLVDWSVAEYYKSGKAAADLLTVAIGPIKPLASTSEVIYFPTTEMNGWTADAPFLFLGGLVSGLVGDNNLPEIQKCASDAETITLVFASIFNDIYNSDMDTLSADIKALLDNYLPYTLRDCMGMDDEIAAIKAWAQIFKNREEFIATITKHMLFHKSEIL